MELCLESSSDLEIFDTKNHSIPAKLNLGPNIECIKVTTKKAQNSKGHQQNPQHFGLSPTSISLLEHYPGLSIKRKSRDDKVITSSCSQVLVNGIPLSSLHKRIKVEIQEKIEPEPEVINLSSDSEELPDKSHSNDFPEGNYVLECSDDVTKSSTLTDFNYEPDSSILTDGSDTPVISDIEESSVGLEVSKVLDEPLKYNTPADDSGIVGSIFGLEADQILETNFVSEETIDKPKSSIQTEASDVLKPDPCYVEEANDIPEVNDTPDCNVVPAEGSDVTEPNTTSDISEVAEEDPSIQCTPCVVLLNRQEIEKYHVSDSDVYIFKSKKTTNKKKFVCDICGYKTSEFRHFRGHTLVHSDKRPYKCQYCDKTFKVKTYLTAHVSTVHKYIKPHYFQKYHKTTTEICYECIDCNIKYNSKLSLDLHNNSVHGLKSERVTLTLTNNNIDNSDTEEIDSDVESVTSIVERYCHICMRYSPSSNSLNNHFKSIHKLNLKLPPPKPVKPAMPAKPTKLTKPTKPVIKQCKFCTFTSAPTRHYMTHIVKHLDIYPYSCNYCGGKYKTKMSILNHCKTAHKSNNSLICNFETDEESIKEIDELENNVEKYKYSCVLCDIYVTSIKQLENHMSKHYKHIPLYKCEYCSYVAKKKKVLILHMYKTHFNYPENALHVCKLCKLSFFCAKELNTHKINYHNLEIQLLNTDALITLDDKTYQCSVCQRIFVNLRNAKNHLAVHNDSKKRIYRKSRCYRCKKYFSTSQEVIDHRIKKHGIFKIEKSINIDLQLTDDIYQCRKCDKFYHYKSDVINHIRENHTEKSSLLCDICHKRAPNLSAMNQHMESHIESPICKICQLNCITIKDLVEHCNNVHTTKNENMELAIPKLERNSPEMPTLLNYDSEMCIPKIEKNDVDMPILDSISPDLDMPILTPGIDDNKIIKKPVPDLIPIKLFQVQVKTEPGVCIMIPENSEEDIDDLIALLPQGSENINEFETSVNNTEGNTECNNQNSNCNLEKNKENSGDISNVCIKSEVIDEDEINENQDSSDVIESTDDLNCENSKNASVISKLKCYGITVTKAVNKKSESVPNSSEICSIDDDDDDDVLIIGTVCKEPHKITIKTEIGAEIFEQNSVDIGNENLQQHPAETCTENIPPLTDYSVTEEITTETDMNPDISKSIPEDITSDNPEENHQKITTKNSKIPEMSSVKLETPEENKDSEITNNTPEEITSENSEETTISATVSPTIHTSDVKPDVNITASETINSEDAYDYKYFVYSYDCLICKSDYETFEQLAHHRVTQHPKDSSYKIENMGILDEVIVDILNCDHCEFATIDKVELEEHITKHLQYMCKYCNKELQYLSELITHEGTHINKKLALKDISNAVKDMPNFETSIPFCMVELPKIDVLDCNKCTFKTIDINLYKEHLISHDIVNKIPCTNCDESFMNENELAVHENNVHNMTPSIKIENLDDIVIKFKFECILCEKRFYSQLSLTQHYKRSHIPCERCSYVANNINELKNHMELTEELYNCKKCNFRPVSHCCLIQHQEKLHNNDNITKTENPIVECELCDYIAINNKDLQLHVNTIHVVKSIKCTVCCQAFKNVKLLHQHEKEHLIIELIELTDDSNESKQEMEIQKSDIFCVNENMQDVEREMQKLHSSCVNENMQDSVIVTQKFDNLCADEIAQDVEREMQKLHSSCVNENMQDSVTVTQKLECADEIAQDVEREMQKLHSSCVNENMQDSVTETQKSDVRENTDDILTVIEKSDNLHVITCNECSATFDSKPQFEDHFLILHASDDVRVIIKLQCNDCNEIFTSKSDLKTHIIKSHQKNEILTNKSDSNKVLFECYNCTEKYTDKIKLKKHMLIKHQTEIGALQCYECQDSFTSKNQLEDHILKIHTLQCKKCDFNTVNNQEFQTHCLTHPDLFMFNCMHCPLKFCTFSDLQKHDEYYHAYKPLTNKILPKLVKKKKNKKHTCIICELELKTANLLQNHYKLKHRKSTRCKHCNFVAKPPVGYSMIEHNKKHRKQVQESDSEYEYESENQIVNDTKNKENLFCSSCEMQFDSIWPYKFHLLSLVHMKKIKSSAWMLKNKGLVLKKKIALRQSYQEQKIKERKTKQIKIAEKKEKEKVKRVVKEKATFKCAHCYKILKCRSSILKHLLSVHNFENENVRCGYCKFSSPDICIIKQHTIENHSNSKPVKCDYCSKMFKSHTSLVAHCKIYHTDEIKVDSKTPLKTTELNQCQYCPKVFKCHKRLLNHHKRVHTEHGTNESNIKTEKCKKKTNLNNVLSNDIDNKESIIKSPIRKNNASILYPDTFVVCELCSKPYKDQASLSSHIAYAHRDHIGYKRIQTKKCDLCSELFFTDRSLKIHHQKVHVENKCRYRCAECSYSTESITSYKTHQSTHTYMPYKCNICSFKFRTNELLEMHTKISHSTQKVKGNNIFNESLKATNVFYNCKDCTFMSNTKPLFDVHAELLKHNLKPIISPNIKTEVVDVEPVPTPNSPRRFQCKICKISLKSEAMLTGHMKHVHDKNIHKVSRKSSCNIKSQLFQNLTKKIAEKTASHRLTQKSKNLASSIQNVYTKTVIQNPKNLQTRMKKSISTILNTEISNSITVPIQSSEIQSQNLELQDSTTNSTVTSTQIPKMEPTDIEHCIEDPDLLLSNYPSGSNHTTQNLKQPIIPNLNVIHNSSQFRILSVDEATTYINNLLKPKIEPNNSIQNLEFQLQNLESIVGNTADAIIKPEPILNVPECKKTKSISYTSTKRKLPVKNSAVQNSKFKSKNDSITKKSNSKNNINIQKPKLNENPTNVIKIELQEKTENCNTINSNTDTKLNYSPSLHKKLYFNQQNMQLSSQRLTRDAPLKCRLCKIFFSTKENLIYHLNDVHDYNKKAYHCKFCTYASHDKSKYEVHLYTHSSIRLFKCTFCPSSFKAARYLKRHVETVHSKIYKSPMKYNCSFCKKVFNEKFKIELHIQTKHKFGKLHKCPQCPFVTAIEFSLTRHLRTHSNYRPFKCSLCSLRFKDLAILRNHERIVHLKEFSINIVDIYK